MFRTCFNAFIIFCLFSHFLLSADEVKLNDAQLQEVLKQLSDNKGKINQKLLQTFTNEMFKNSKQQLPLTSAFWQYLEENPEIKQGLMISRYPLDHKSINKFAMYFNGLDKNLAVKYRQLLLGASLKHPSEKAISTETPELENDIKLLTDYLKANNKSLIDVSANTTELLKNVPLKTPEKSLKDLFNAVAIRSGIYPAVTKASPLDSLKFIIENQEKSFTITVPAGMEKKAAANPMDYQWPMFPLEKAPWPLLIEMGMEFNLNEAKFIWNKFLAGEGIVRYSKYGSTWQAPEKLYRKSDWNPNSLCRVLEDGGVCGRQANLAIDTNIIFGIPSTNMGQPGHAAVAAFGFDKVNNKYYGYQKQSVAGLKESSVRWSLGLEGKIRNLEHKNFAGIEYYFGHALSVNNGLENFHLSRLALHLVRNSTISTQQKIDLLESALNLNPYNTEVIYTLTEHYGANLDKVNSLVGKLRKLVNSSGEVDFGETRGTDTDFAKISEVKPTKGDFAAGNAQGWILLVCSSIIEHAYSQLEVSQENIAKGYEFLKQEQTYQKSIKKSPYLESINNFLNIFEIRLNGPQTYQTPISKELQTRLNSKKTADPKDEKAFLSKIDMPIKYMKNDKERADYYKVYRQLFTEEQIYNKDESGKPIALNGMFNSIIRNELSYLKKSGKEHDNEYKELNALFGGYMKKVTPPKKGK